MKMLSDVPEGFLYRDFVDIRKSINGLVVIVEQQLHWLFDGFDVLGHQAISYETVSL
ncbi:hypothetical protein Q4574_11440 [Aliiglaciecola sp. 3_MG-2023]|uniref:hypothetical protein n=1 Tax=Aliiglaciecola sp. 3_MG-2023 TaxID=3062644 RepID=UPI0026E3598D|nr:hypothetical protein [Aliiglaciecola sp. 3_MG-2023]MDO6693900.1 hypothetical protein [Aliiglaciecola sp. 3_MG-2023]